MLFCALLNSMPSVMAASMSGPQLEVRRPVDAMITSHATASSSEDYHDVTPPRRGSAASSNGRADVIKHGDYQTSTAQASVTSRNAVSGSMGGLRAPNPLANANNMVGSYILSKTLGEGSAGRVKLGVHQDTQQRVAVKIIPKDQMNSRKAVNHKIEREIAIMRLIEHPSILNLYDVYETDRELYVCFVLFPLNICHHILHRQSAKSGPPKK